MVTMQQNKEFDCNLAQNETNDLILLWHTRMGNLGFKNVEIVAKNTRVKGLEKYRNKRLHFKNLTCDTCINRERNARTDTNEGSSRGGSSKA